MTLLACYPSDEVYPDEERQEVNTPQATEGVQNGGSADEWVRVPSGKEETCD